MFARRRDGHSVHARIVGHAIFRHDKRRDPGVESLRLARKCYSFVSCITQKVSFYIVFPSPRVATVTCCALVLIVLFEMEKDWRWISAISGVQPLLFLVGVVFVPDSPYFLVKQGKWRTCRAVFFLSSIAGLVR